MEVWGLWCILTVLFPFSFLYFEGFRKLLAWFGVKSRGAWHGKSV